MKKGAGAKPDLKTHHQEFVPVTKKTANISYLTHVTREKWGNDVTADGLDSLSTKGKLGSRGVECWLKKGMAKVWSALTAVLSHRPLQPC